MKLTKELLLLSSVVMLAACANTAGGIALNTQNASTYINLEKYKEGNINGIVSGKTVSFKLYPNPEGGKVFSDNIKGKCSFSVRYSDGTMNSSLQVTWGESKDIKDISFAYKAGETDESGNQEMDYLTGSYELGEENPRLVCIYNFQITEISGNMHA